MREKFRDIPSFDLEDRADKALKSGAFADAEAYLTELLKNTSPRSDKFHHALLKQTALPLYEMAYGVDDPDEYLDVYQDANDIFGLAGRLLQQELRTFPASGDSGIGRISELTFFALGQHAFFSEATESVMLPAPAIDDKNGIDFYQSPVNTQGITDGRAFQIKTRATPKVREEYKRSRTILISMSDIDRHATNPRHPQSLPCTILRVLRTPFLGGLDQFNPDKDQQRLDRATREIEKIALLKENPNRNNDALARTSLVALNMDAA
jgi:hypothetical protein